VAIPCPALPLILVGGPTASGKSGLALAIAEEFGGWVVNADSMQVYRDLPILTARPTPDEEGRVPHRLYGVLDGAELCSAQRWRDMATRTVEEARRAGALPVLVGGTGLYFRALTRGLAEVPPIPEAVRLEARALHRRIGGPAFHAALAARDPEAAGRLAPGDTQRMIRAYEVIAATGTPLGEWQRRGQAGTAGGRRQELVLLPPRDELYRACDTRFRMMVEAGAEAEVRRLVERRLDPALPIMKAVGVRELAAALRGEISREEAVARAQQATRNYAKRQYTWFRHQMPEATIVSEQLSESLRSRIFAILREFLLTGRNEAV
jgi:tRNA dimethylallyltransferase